MGRIVYFSFPAHGHINPTLPVIRELAGRKEQVFYFSTCQFGRAIGETGAAFCPYTSGLRMPEHGPGPFAQLSTTIETLLEFTCAVLDVHLEQVKLLRPTHIMYDSFAPWGRLFAQLLRLPSIASVPSILVNGAIDRQYGAGPGRSPEDPRLTPQWCASIRSRCHTRLRPYNLPEPLSPTQLLQTYGDLNVVYTSRLFQPLAECFDRRRFQFVGPCFEFRPDAPSFPFERLDDRPLVLVSLGTVYGDRPDFIGSCLEELAGAPWQVVLSAGSDFDIEDCGLPKNVIVRPFVPQIEVLRRCAAFVTHGGMNSVQEALYYGVPLVMAPQAADQFWISARASQLGAAVVLDPPRMKAGAIRASVAKVLSGERYTSAAARIARSLHAAGGHAKAADEIQGFVARTSPAGLSGTFAAGKCLAGEQDKDEKRARLGDRVSAPAVVTGIDWKAT
jgi:MGT family glycosyltransferase